MQKRPIIGITPGYMRDRNKLSLGLGYINGVTKAGGLAFILPLCLEDGVVDRILEAVDGILFSGGGDIDARYFGEENLKCGGEISPERDSFELLLAKRAIARKMPVLGICRGLQILNVALGGTIYQDIHTGQLQGNMLTRADLLKHWQEAPDWYPIHDVHIIAGSRLHQIYCTETLGVNSFHHQAIRDAGNGLVTVASSSDGILEAIEATDSSFIIAVQWHPELMWQENPIHLRIFEALVEEADAFSSNAFPVWNKAGSVI